MLKNFVCWQNLQVRRFFEHLTVQRIKPDPKFFIGSGKAEEIAELVHAEEVQLVIFDQALRLPKSVI